MRRGFTLVEVLLATLILGILTVVTTLTFQSVSRGWQVSTDYMDKMQRTDYALNQVVSGLRSMYYPHDGEQNDKYGFVLADNGDGNDPRTSDVIEWSKKGPAIVGTKNAIADTVHRVQVMVLEEGNSDYREPIQKTGLYARLCGDSALIPKDDGDDTDYTFGNADLYQPLLISDGVVGFNCRVIKTQGDAEEAASSDSGNDKKKFEDEFAESNSVPYKVELTFKIEQADEESFGSRGERAPMVRIVRIPIHEQSLDGSAPPTEDGDAEGGEKKKTVKRGVAKKP